MSYSPSLISEARGHKVEALYANRRLAPVDICIASLSQHLTQTGNDKRRSVYKYRVNCRVVGKPEVITRRALRVGFVRGV